MTQASHCWAHFSEVLDRVPIALEGDIPRTTARHVTGEGRVLARCHGGILTGDRCVAEGQERCTWIWDERGDSSSVDQLIHWTSRIEVASPIWVQDCS